MCDFCLQSTLFLRHLCTPVGQTHAPCVPTCLLPANHLDNRTNHQGQSSMFKVQNQSPYMPHNNQLVHPFARQLSTKRIINDLHLVFQSQLFRRAIWLVSSRNMTHSRQHGASLTRHAFTDKPQYMTTLSPSILYWKSGKMLPMTLRAPSRVSPRLKCAVTH